MRNPEREENRRAYFQLEIWSRYHSALAKWSAKNAKLRKLLTEARAVIARQESYIDGLEREEKRLRSLLPASTESAVAQAASCDTECTGITPAPAADHWPAPVREWYGSAGLEAVAPDDIFGEVRRRAIRRQDDEEPTK